MRSGLGGREPEGEKVPDPTFAELLGARVATAVEQRTSLETAIGQMRLARSLTVADDEHDPEGSTVSLDQARDVALLERVTRTLAELGAAQERLAAGTYGVCENCRQPIAPERLAARPAARVCIDCAA